MRSECVSRSGAVLAMLIGIGFLFPVLCVAEPVGGVLQPARFRLPQIPAGGDGTGGALAEPPNFVPRKVELFEAHWQGLDVRLLNEELRRKLKFPKGLQGILVGEVTLNAAAAGILAGDVIVRVEDVPVATVEDFQLQTRLVKDRNQARLALLRKGKPEAGGAALMTQMTVVLRGEPDLGFAQVEGAPMILPGAERPHPYRGPCTNCHAVGRGFELTPDPDLITLPPPPITSDGAIRGMRPHEDRGPCEACHVIVRQDIRAN
ncbi:MAG: PDZ domain-containing protein [Alphaproteobacteria bacterium]|nr:PDZ domain-containing protein [Alphaproteobacteria bacterium]